MLLCARSTGSSPDAWEGSTQSAGVLLSVCRAEQVILKTNFDQQALYLKLKNYGITLSEDRKMVSV